ncbi:hypothetical protein EWM64_g2921 [Hericium alpestre]|uniref:Uncharacterized protein n=1 Tax=Hericium alpestre TaxID=135208 RepID=A0A4Z0A4B7_9AGAM|nr:hypothetical protein EWM64_g2921 [Hericium alpestre]
MALVSNHGHPLTLTLDVKRIRQKWDDDKGKYLFLDDIELEAKDDTKDESEAVFAFSLIRRFVPGDKDGYHLIDEMIQLDSPAFIRAAKEVMKGRRDVAWERKPLKFEPDELMAFTTQFTEYVESLEKLAEKTEEEQQIIEHVRFFLNFIHTEYRERLQELESLKAAQVVTFHLIWSVLVPGMILLTYDKMTGKPWAVRLLSLEIHERSSDQPLRWILNCEFVAVEGDMPGLAEIELTIPHFVGAKRILDLVAYPFDQLALDEHRKKKEELIARGRKRWTLKDWQHKWYDDIAYTVEDDDRYRKIMTKSRIMIDGEMFDRYSRHGHTPSLRYDLDGEVVTPDSRKEPNDDDFFLMSPRLYGYTLGDREWLAFSVDCVEDIQWSHNVFEDLDMEEENKNLVKSLVEQHTGARSDDGDGNARPGVSARKFDDFVESKGLGLIFNLHGPPGVGKTLTAEAISDVSRSPLYVVGSSDLGTYALDLEEALSKVFALAHRWKAVVLIDEADVYLERATSTT